MASERGRRRDRLAAMLFGDQLTPCLRLANHQRPPAEIRGGELVALGGDQHVADHVGVAEGVPEQLAAPDDPQQLERRIGASSRAGLPVADRSIGDLQQLRDTLNRPPEGEPQLPELSRADELEAGPLALGSDPRRTSRSWYLLDPLRSR